MTSKFDVINKNTIYPFYRKSRNCIYLNNNTMFTMNSDVLRCCNVIY